MFNVDHRAQPQLWLLLPCHQTRPNTCANMHCSIPDLVIARRCTGSTAAPDDSASSGSVSSSNKCYSQRRIEGLVVLEARTWASICPANDAFLHGMVVTLSLFPSSNHPLPPSSFLATPSSLSFPKFLALPSVFRWLSSASSFHPPTAPTQSLTPTLLLTTLAPLGLSFL